MTRNTAGNSTYPKVAVQWLNQALCFYQSFCLVDSEVLRNPQHFIPPTVMGNNMKTMKHFLLISIILMISCTSNQNTIIVEESRVNTIKSETKSEINEEKSFEDDNHDLVVKLKNSTIRVNIKTDTLYIFNESDTLKKITSNELAYVDGYNFFHYNNNLFFKVQITYYGTGYNNFDYLFIVDTINCRLDSVEIEYASSYYQKYLEKGKGIWKGEGRQYRTNQISGIFQIYNDSDANCCPTGGFVKVRYIIEKINDRYKMHQDTCIYEKL
ncbi:MAG: hypothetical protein ABFC55_05440 [Tenuifilaceae bacterium]